MEKLELGMLYNRKQVHAFFGGDSTFTPGAGTWGLQGMLRTADDRLSWVFFVTLGHKEGQHQFDEGITEEGVLTWQSQPKLSLNSFDIQDLIHFDHDKHNIYLFLRKNKKEDYQYLGHLSYLTHDISREKPVYFEWQLLDWALVKDALNPSIIQNLPINHNQDKESLLPGLQPGRLPSQSKGRKQFSRKFSGNLNPDSSHQKLIGDIGEELVVDFEKQRLINEGFGHLAQQIEHSSKLIGDGLGYDIKSFNTDGTYRYIEVKTTTQSSAACFYMSLNEFEFAKLHVSSYFIYRVYKLDEHTKTGLVFEIPGIQLLENNLYDFEPTMFKVNLRS